MSYRSTHRWFRTMALGLAFASVMLVGRVSVAAAKFDEGPDVTRSPKVIPYLSHGMLTEADAIPSQGTQTPYMSLAEGTYGLTRDLPEPFVAGVTDFPRAPLPAVRPDDAADRFSHSDVPTQPELASSGDSRVERDDAVVLGLGAIVLALALGLALGHLRRPRLAGL